MKRLMWLVCAVFFVFGGRDVAADVDVVFNNTYTITNTQRLKVSIPHSWLQAGHVYTMTTGPANAQTNLYGDPYIWSVVYTDSSTTRRVVRESRNPNDLEERESLHEGMWNPGENRGEFWVQCEVSSCQMRVTIYEREEGTFDDHTFYREGVEPDVIDGQFSLFKNYYDSVRKSGDYGLQVLYDPDRYIYLYRNNGFDTDGMNALSFWIRTAGSSIDENDLELVFTSTDHQIITNWLPFSDYVTIETSGTWYRVLVPLEDLLPTNVPVVGLAIRSDSPGFVYFDDVELVEETVFRLRLPVDGYTPFTVPVSAVMDNSLNDKGRITAHNGQEARFENGCKEYVGSGTFDDCMGTIGNYDPPDDVLGYTRTGGGLFSLGINYNDGISPSGREYLFYDEHTGYDFIPAGVQNLTIPVYAAAGGTVSYGDARWNEVIIDHSGTDCTTHYLHMKLDSFLVGNGATVSKGQRIGTIGTTGGVAPHLHFTVKCDGDRVDPYREGLWE